LEKVFDMDFLQKYFYGVFELPLPKDVLKKKAKKKKVGGVGGWVWDLVKSRGGPSGFFLAAPRIWPAASAHFRLPAFGQRAATRNTQHGRRQTTDDRRRQTGGSGSSNAISVLPVLMY
jgi:hypothetical protein